MRDGKEQVGEKGTPSMNQEVLPNPHENDHADHDNFIQEVHHLSPANYNEKWPLFTKLNKSKNRSSCTLYVYFS